jgi:hypothetical protein
MFLAIGSMPVAPASAAKPDRPTNVDEHPLAVPVHVARNRFELIRTQVKDYSCILVKRERVDGILRDYEYMFAKIRHEQRVDGRVVTPFSVYLRFLAPAKIKGREVLYVNGQNDGELLARKGGERFSFVTMSLDPLGGSAMRGNRYPITEIGIKRLTQRLIELGQESMRGDAAWRECRVQYFQQSKVGDRLCTCIQVEHPVRRDSLPSHLARIYLDDELQVPIRYEAYDWPTEPGGEPPLLEEYTYLNLKLNEGFTDKDFDRGNPAYGFR